MIFSRLMLLVCVVGTTHAFSPAAIKPKSTTELSSSASNNSEDEAKKSAESSSNVGGRRSFVKNLVAAGTVLSVSTVLSPSTTLPAFAAADLDAKSSFSTPETGKKAPSFVLPSSRGEGSTSLDDLTKSGKWTVLYFYPGAFSTGCTLEAKSFQRDIQEYRNFNAQIVGVSVDPPEKNEAFCSATGLDFYMLSDVGGKVSTEYGSAVRIPGFGTFSNRQTYLIDPQGNLRWVFTGVENRIPTHSKEVLAKLTELEGGQATA